jgi:cbb3-type cytochrome oxidase subunit 3
MSWLATHAGMLGLIFFFVMFVGTAFWLYLPGGRDRHEPHKFIPLAEPDHD